MKNRVLKVVGLVLALLLVSGLSAMAWLMLISPVAAYSAEKDAVLVLDVAAYKYPATWVPLPKLWHAMQGIDPDSGKTRGYLLASP